MTDSEQDTSAGDVDDQLEPESVEPEGEAATGSAPGRADSTTTDRVADEPANETGADEEEPAAAQFGELRGNGEGKGTSLDMLYDLTLPVSIELGRAEMTVEEVLELGRGSVIQLERLAGEPIDVYVGDRRLAEGEVVVVGEYFGVRLTRILSSAPNLEQMDEGEPAP